MAFDPNTTVFQGAGTPFCGAACAVYAHYWLNDSEYIDDQDEITTAMRTTAFGCGCTNALGSSPANIAKYIKNRNNNSKIYAPTNILCNLSSRPWYPVLRIGLMATCSEIDWSFGFKCLFHRGVIGQDYIIIHFVSKNMLSADVSCFDYFNSHFVVETYGNRIMDPADALLKNNEDFWREGWESRELDLYIYRA
jgi:hypothetical protein